VQTPLVHEIELSLSYHLVQAHITLEPLQVLLKSLQQTTAFCVKWTINLVVKRR